MAKLTMDDLKRILWESAGEDEEVGLDDDIADIPFSDLGYDSLALLETAAQIKREYGVVIPDDDLPALTTPAELLDKVNAALV